MAKKKAPAVPATEKVNKSESIRKYLADHPGTANKEAAEALKDVLGSDLKKGAAMVAQVKTLDKKKSGKGKRGRKPATAAAAVSAPAASSSGIDIAAAIKAGRELLKAAGSPADAAAVIKALGG